MTVAAPPVVEVRNLTKHFAVPRGLLGLRTGKVHAVDGVSFRVQAGETLGVVGESGCGKSTTGKLILKLIEPTAGEIYLDGERIDALSRGAMRRRRSGLQVVFQDPYSSLNPRLRANEIVAEPLRNFSRLPRARIDDRVAELFEQVGLRRDQMVRFPHEFSGGQRQRLVIARALALKPISASPTSSSPTIWRSWSTSRIVSQSCISAALSSWRSGALCLRARNTLTRKRCSPRCRFRIRARSHSA